MSKIEELRALWHAHGFPFPSLNRDLARYLAWQRSARLVLQKSLKDGSFIKVRDSGLSCVDCDGPATCWEHRDYSKPLDVEPCCHGCNVRRAEAHVPDYFPEPTTRQLLVRAYELERLESISMAKRGKKPPRRKS